MENDNTNKEHSAVDNWSGFIYQGKIASYYTIRLLRENQNISGLLQIEYLNDFSLHDDNKQVVSLHQVKAHAPNTINHYKEDIVKLKDKAVNINCHEAFLHLANITTDADNIIEFMQEYSPVKVFQYSSGIYFCSVGDIDIQVEDMIRQYYRKYHPDEEWRLRSDYVLMVRVYLYEKIQLKVSKIHDHAQKTGEKLASIAGDEYIPLSDIRNMLDSNMNEKLDSEEYNLYKTMQDIRRYFNEYIVENIIDAASIEHIAAYLACIEKLDYESLKRFVQNITPHRETAFLKNNEYKDALQGEEVKSGILKILNELNRGCFDESRCLICWEADQSKYYPTTISSIDCENICRRILENAKRNNVSLLFDSGKLVTRHIDIVSVYKGAPDVLPDDIDVESRAQQEHHIMRWRDIALVSLNNAKGELNA